MPMLPNLLLVALLAAAPLPAPAGQVEIVAPRSPQIQHGIGKLEAAVTGSGAEFGTVQIEIDSGRLGPESFELARAPGSLSLTINAGGPTGAMYGLLDLAERIRGHLSLETIETQTQSPRFPFRAIKFNLPWFAYRSNDAITLHYDACRDLGYWEAFLDMMAENRFNALTLWNLHPWPYLVRPTNFPYANTFSDEEMAEWRTLYSGIFRLARDRGIETYLVNWNIFVSEGFRDHHGLDRLGNISVERGIRPEIAELARQYNREAVTQVLNEYPDLTGIGLSLGEAMGGMTAPDRERWILDTIIAGIRAADRPTKLIHRVPFSAGLSNGGSTSRTTEEITRRALEGIEGITPPIWVEVKFNWSHGHSTPKLVKTHGGELNDTYWNPAPENYRMTWMIRNEDFFMLRWGVPEFIRSHIALNGQEYVGGYFVGSETYIPAVDYFTRDLEKRPWRYAFERQWLFYKLWGRLLYDPSTPDAVFEADFTRRYGDAGPALFRAIRLASRMPLHLASFIEINNDKSLYSEGFLARDREDSSEFLDLDLMLRKGTLDPDLVSPSDYARALHDGQPVADARTTPLELADQLEAEASEAMDWIAGIESGGDEALRQELTDIRAWCGLGRYFAEKLRAAVELASYRLDGDGTRRTAARDHILKAIAHWESVIEVTLPVYRIVPLTHLHQHENNLFHWLTLRDEVHADLDLIEREP
ncbi:MAG: hypothetical protein R3F07_00755 [Opitutaceae bacterium]